MNQGANQRLSTALDYMQSGKVHDAEILLREIIKSEVDCDDAYHVLGLIYAGREEFNNAKECFKEAMRIKPDNPVYLSNYANTLQDTWNVEESLPYYKKALDINPEFVDGLYNMGNSLRKLQRFSEALHFYNLAKKVNPKYIRCYVNIAFIFESMRQLDRAIEELFAALRIEPNSYETLVSLATLFSNKKDYDQSMIYFKKAFETGLADDKFFINYGLTCVDNNQPAEAAKAFLKSAEISPSKNSALGKGLHQKMLIADWVGIKELNSEIVRRLRMKEDVADPFGYMGISDSESDLQLVGCAYLNKKFPVLPRDFIAPKYPRHKKIKIAYVSGEFREHANGSLMTGLIECHDKEKFEVIGLDNGSGDQSDLRRRLIASFDEYIDIREIGDFDLMKQLQSKEVDILFNLNGFF